MVLITAYNNIIKNDLNLEIVKKPITNTNAIGSNSSLFELTVSLIWLT